MAFVVLVSIRVKPDCVGAFLEATRRNQAGTVAEPGALRFDVIQDRSDPTHICLYEVYRSPADLDAHRETDHFKKWRDAAEPLMSEPRTRVFYEVVDPDPYR